MVGSAKSKLGPHSAASPWSHKSRASWAAIRSDCHPMPWHLRSFSDWAMFVPREPYPVVLSPHLRLHTSLEYMLPSPVSVNAMDETLGHTESLLTSSYALFKCSQVSCSSNPRLPVPCHLNGLVNVHPENLVKARKPPRTLSKAHIILGNWGRRDYSSSSYIRWPLCPNYFLVGLPLWLSPSWLVCSRDTCFHSILLYNDAVRQLGAW